MQHALREAEAADELRREAEQTAAAVRIQAVHRGRLSRRAGAARQYSVDSRWGQQFLAGLGPSGARASRPARHTEGSRDYLRRLMLPRLGAAMRAAEAARPEDPAAFIAAQLRQSSCVLKEWEETAPAAERQAAAERREADGAHRHPDAVSFCTRAARRGMLSWRCACAHDRRHVFDGIYCRATAAHRRGKIALSQNSTQDISDTCVA